MVLLHAALGVGAAVAQQHVERFAWRDVHLGADVAHGDDGLLDPLQIVQRLLVFQRGVVGRERLQHDGVCGRAGQRLHALPDGFGDERNDRVRQAQQRFQHGDQRVAGAALFRFATVAHHRLGQLQIPVAELVPGEFVQDVGRQIEAVGVQRFAVGFHRAVEFGQIQRSASDSTSRRR